MDTQREAEIAHRLLTDYKNDHRFSTRKWVEVSIIAATQNENGYNVRVGLDVNPNAQNFDQVHRVELVAHQLGVLNLVSDVQVELQSSQMAR